MAYRLCGFGGQHGLNDAQFQTPDMLEWIIVKSDLLPSFRRRPESTLLNITKRTRMLACAGMTNVLGLAAKRCHRTWETL